MLPDNKNPKNLTEGRYKGIRNKKRKSSLAHQTRDLRKTFGVAPGKIRRAGPRASMYEDLITAINEKNYTLAEQLFNEHMESITEHHLMEMKKTIDLAEGVGNYSLKKVKKYKNPEKMSPEEIWDNDGNDASYTKYHVTKDGKTIGRLRRHDYFGGTFARINGKTTELKKGKSGSGPLSKLHAYVKYKKGKLEEANPWSGAGEYIKAGIKNDAKKISKQWKEMKPDIVAAKDVAKEKIRSALKPVAKTIGDYNSNHPDFGMTKSHSNKKMNEGYYKNKQIEKDEEARGEPPFIPDDPKAPHHTSKNLARRAKKAMIRKTKEKLNEGREVPNPSGKKWYEGRIRREKDIPDEAPKSKKKKKVRKYGSYLRSKLGYEPGRD